MTEVTAHFLSQAGSNDINESHYEVSARLCSGLHMPEENSNMDSPRKTDKLKDREQGS